MTIAAALASLLATVAPDSTGVPVQNVTPVAWTGFGTALAPRPFAPTLLATAAIAQQEAPAFGVSAATAQPPPEQPADAQSDEPPGPPA